jgi:hypothetical protein
MEKLGAFDASRDLERTSIGIKRVERRTLDVENLKQQLTTLNQKTKEEELARRKSESQRAELEYNLRACEYNVEILKN